jgi:hypothetical protein
MSDDKKFLLADLLTALGAELREAQRRAGADEQPDLLKLKECTVELGISWEKKGEAGIEFYVIKLEGGLDKTNTETLTVTLEPLGAEPVVLDIAEGV